MEFHRTHYHPSNAKFLTYGKRGYARGKRVEKQNRRRRERRGGESREERAEERILFIPLSILGDLPLERHLEHINRHALSKFEKTDLRDLVHIPDVKRFSDPLRLSLQCPETPSMF